jgi:uncharacterized protein
MRAYGLVLASVLLLGFGAGMAEAASFNCARARTADERAICADRALNDQDVRMALLFDISRHLVAMGRRGQLEDEQTAWLRGRKACGANRQCLASAYRHRIARLQGVVDGVASHGPF